MSNNLHKLKLEIRYKELLTKYDYNSTIILNEEYYKSESNFVSFDMFIYICRYCNPCEHPYSLITLFGCYEPSGYYRKNNEYYKNLNLIFMGNKPRLFIWFTKLIEHYTDQELFKYYLFFKQIWFNEDKLYELFKNTTNELSYSRLYADIIRYKCYEHFKFIISNNKKVTYISC